MSCREEGKELGSHRIVTAILVCSLLKTKQEQMFGTRFQKKMQNIESGAGYQKDKHSRLYCSAHVEQELCLGQSASAALEPELRCGGLSRTVGGCSSRDLVRLSPLQHGAWLTGWV